MKNKKKKPEVVSRTDWFSITILLIIFTLTLFFQIPDGKLHVYFLDVGQGDAIFLETPAGAQILIDGGPDGEVIQQLGKVMPFYDRSIDMVILTHPDSDHISGLIKVLDRYKIDKIVETGVFCDTSQCRAWRNAKIKEKAENFFVSLGDKIILEDGATLYVLHPFEDLKDKEIPKKNNTSVVLKLVYNNQSVLLTGDIEKSVENKLILSGLNIDSDFLKVAHHGSKTSTTREFLESITPIAAFISVGENSRYGHPHPEVIERLENFPIKYYRTDRDGIVELILGDQSYVKIKN